MAEHDHRLRRVEGDDLHPAVEAHLRGVGQRRALGRQLAQQVVEQIAQRLGVDVAHGRRHDPVARQGVPVRREQILARQRLDRGRGALHRRAVGVIPEGGLGEGLRGDGAGVGGVGAEPRQHLRAHPLHRVVVEARLHERVAQERHGLVAVLR